MPKFDFRNSRYARFFSDTANQRFLATFINTEGVIYTNYGWYLTQGKKASAPTPTDKDGTATFTVKSRSLEAAPLMDLRAPLGDSNQMDKSGLATYSATIPDFIAPGWAETAMEREYRVRQFELFGNDADIVKAWVDDVQLRVDSADTTLNNLTAQLMSTGKIDYTGLGRGIKMPLHKTAIPAENFVKAGAKVWTDVDCMVLEQMKDIEDKYRDKRGYTGALVWQMPRKMFFEVLLENAQVKKLIESYKANPYAWQATTQGQSFTEQAFRQAVVDYQGLSPIEIVTEKERNLTHTKDVFIHGWAENVAVLRPAGDAVEFEYAENLDRLMFEKYGSKAVNKVFAQTNNGLGTLVNTTLDNGMFQEWHTDLMMTAVPALLEFPDHLIVDTQTAGV